MTSLKNSLLSALTLSGIVLTAIGCATSASSGANKEEKSNKPNVVIILADQWRGQAMGFLRKIFHNNLFIAVNNYLLFLLISYFIMNGRPGIVSFG